MDNNEELFKGVSFSDLMSDVYHNSKRTSRQINQLISQLQPLIRSSSDATIIVPLIADDTLTSELESELNSIESEEKQLHQKIETAKDKLKKDSDV